MARFARGTAEVDAPDVEAPEAEPSATEPANPDAEDVSGQPVTEAPEVVDLNGFNAAVDALDANEPNYDAVKAAYDALSRKGKVQATRSISTRTMVEVEAGNLAKAQSLTKTKRYFESLTPTSTATPADPTVELVNRIAALRIAAVALETNSGLSERVSAAIESPNEIVQALATKLQETKAARKPRDPGSKRHNVSNHITQVMAGQESGRFLDAKGIAEATSEEYDGGSSTKNAVEAKLKSGKFSSDGLTVETVDDKIGVRKS